MTKGTGRVLSMRGGGISCRRPPGQIRQGQNRRRLSWQGRGVAKAERASKILIPTVRIILTSSGLNKIFKMEFSSSQRVFEQVQDSSQLSAAPTELPAVTVVAVERYLAQAPPAARPSQYCSLVLQAGTLLFLTSHCSYRYDEKRLNLRLPLLEGLEWVGSSAAAGTPPDGHRPLQPLRGDNRHYLPLWNNEDPYGDMWVPDRPPVQVDVDGPSQYATYIATIHPDNNRETVGSVANKLRNYESIISSPMQAQVSAVAKELRKRMEEVTEKTEEMMRRNSSHVAPVQGEARENRVYWTVWIRWPGTSEPQKYEALVDTGSQCTLVPSECVRTEPISIAGVTGGSQELTLLEAEVSLTGKEWQKHPIVTGSGALCILSIDFLQNGYYKDSKGLRWAFGIAAVEAEGIKKLNSLPGLLENPSAVGLLKVEEQRVPVATSTVHRRQYRKNRDAVIPIHKMIRELESQGVVSKTHSPFHSPIWPVRKPDGEWRLTVDYCALNEVTPPLSAAVPDMLELQYELESKAAKWYATIDIANAFFSIPLAAECRPQFAFTWRGMQYT
ncbi:hypothetical protein DUI87_01447 [Hirundo rustica rustica]|uniref:Reverse transcriptase domain-containing protein n=1 Tax=Hirundo rustica rustica TaxID=333673 RepID=A0A3M0L5C1_HIRRU|nr:hypothetical protein DUI87_01447 [Hirundo rustica rustica]